MRRLLAAALALLLLAAGPAAVAGERGQVINDEVVLVVLDPSGLPQTATLISRITSTGGPARTIEDPSSTTNVSYRDRPGAPDTVPEAVLVAVGGEGTATVLTEALFDRPLPVALHAQYAIDGRVVNPAQVLGATGGITVTYTATNTTAQEQSISYTDAAGVARSTALPVFAPFAGTLVVTVPRGMTVVDATGATSSADASGATVLRFDLLLAPPAGDFTATMVVQLRAMDGAATPAAVMAVAPVTGGENPALGFAEDLLTQSSVASNELAAGLAALDDGAGGLAQGAAALAAGTAGLAAGQGALTSALGTGAQGAAMAAAGSSALAGGLAQITAGLQQLSGPEGLGAAGAAAGRLESGAAQLADIVGSATDGPGRRRSSSRRRAGRPTCRPGRRSRAHCRSGRTHWQRCLPRCSA